MTKRDIIVIGASTGGFEVICRIIAGLPPNLDASVFIVWHMSADIRGILPDVLNKQQTLMAANAIDKEPIVPNRIYVAPPDKHLVIEKGRVRVTHGAKENRFRPAIDPLFRSAAYAYRERVIGVILSGGLDDGTAGLWAIKNSGGTAVVQDPSGAQVSSMPASAVKEVAVDHIVPADHIAPLLIRLVAEAVPTITAVDQEDSLMNKEIEVVLLDKNANKVNLPFGDLSTYACPECHGVLSAIQEAGRVRYRCHTGHAFSTNSLFEALSDKTEDSLWNAVRGMEESILLLNHWGDHFAEFNQPHLAALYFQKANEVLGRIKILRNLIQDHEKLNSYTITVEAESLNHLS